MIFSVGMIGLGVLALVYGDFALVWQPVPAWLPGRTVIAYSSGILMVLSGFALLCETTVKWATRIVFGYLIVWMMLKVPPLFVTPQIEGVWLGVGELVVLMTGGWVLFARLGQIPERSPVAFATGESGIRIARILFAISLIPIGLSHFVYSKETAELVPSWLPFRIGWAYLTGAGHIAAGIGVLFSIWPRAAALSEAAMLSLFTLLVWVPAIAAAPRTRLPWTAFFISWAITSAAWLVACNVWPQKVARLSVPSDTAATNHALRHESGSSVDSR